MGKKISKEKQKSIVSEHASFDAKAKNSSRKEKNNHSRSFGNCFHCLKGNSDDVKSQDDQFIEEKRLNSKEMLNKSQISSVNFNHDSLTEKASERKETCSSTNLHNAKSTEVSQLAVKNHELQEQSHSIHMEKKEHDRGHSKYDSASATDNFQPHETVYDDASSYQRKRNKSKFSLEHGHKNAFVNQGGYVPNMGKLAGLHADAVKVGMNGSSAKVVDELLSSGNHDQAAPKSVCQPADVGDQSLIACQNIRGEKSNGIERKSKKSPIINNYTDPKKTRKNKWCNVDEYQNSYNDQESALSSVPIRTPTDVNQGLEYSGKVIKSYRCTNVIHLLPTTAEKLHLDEVPGISPKSAQLEETQIEETGLTSSKLPDNDLSNKFVQCNDQDERMSADLKVASNVIDNKLKEWKMVAGDHIKVNSQGDVEVIPVAEYNEQIQNSTNISEIRSHEEESAVAMEEITTKESAVTSAKETNENPGKRRNKRKKKNKNSNIHSGGNTDNSIIHSSKSDVMSKPHSEIKQDGDLISSMIIHRQPRGLVNLGNTCFFNAVMQNLNQSFLLQHCLSNYLMQCAGKTSCFPLTKAMDDFYKEMSITKSSYNPSGVFRNICTKSPRFSGGHQQDSHELLRHLLDGLRAEEREVFPQSERRKILTNIDRVFGGHFLTVYTCEECKMPYHVCEPMLDISLPIAFDDSEEDDEEVEDFTSDQLNLSKNMESSLGYNQATKYLMSPLNESGKIQTGVDNTCDSNSTNELLKNKTKGKRNAAEEQRSLKRLRKERSIHDCLKAFTRVESIKEEYFCITCNAGEGAAEPRMSSAKKRTLIYNPPALLTLHLKRFEQSDQGFVKCNDQISFESQLDLGPYCSRYCKRNEQKEKTIWYSLYGVVVHGGSLSGGHYVAYVKKRSFEKNTDQYLQTEFLDRNLLTNDELVRQVKDFQCKTAAKFQAEWKPKSEPGSWYYISDCHSSQVDEKEVMRQQAYLLFYERIARENMETSMARDKLENAKTGLYSVTSN